jgi:hypothetical protein
METNGIRDGRRSGVPAEFILRNPIHLFGSGALQKLAEQATAELLKIRADAIARAQRDGAVIKADLKTSNGVTYGYITVNPQGAVDVSNVRGVDPDLIVKPYFWKGELASFLRALTRGSAELELGMQPIELVGPQNDFDFDGVVDEISVGDVTAMTVYLAAQPRPVTKLELSAQLGGRHTLRPDEIRTIKAGERLFASIGCVDCHRPVLELRDPLFREPSRSAEYRDQTVLNGLPPQAIGLDPLKPAVVDLSANPTVGRTRNGTCAAYDFRWQMTQTADRRGGNRLCFPQFELAQGGGIRVALYGDLKRHDMGPGLAEKVDEIGTGVAMWKTRELWGVGNTGPWLHDGRATTLSEAVLWHGGEAQAARDAYVNLSESDRDKVIAFLKNLVLYKPSH